MSRSVNTLEIFVNILQIIHVSISVDILQIFHVSRSEVSHSCLSSFETGPM